MHGIQKCHDLSINLDLWDYWNNRRQLRYAGVFSSSLCYSLAIACFMSSLMTVVADPLFLGSAMRSLAIRVQTHGCSAHQVFFTAGYILSCHIYYMAIVKERVLSSLFYSICHQIHGKFKLSSGDQQSAASFRVAGWTNIRGALGSKIGAMW